MQTAGKTLTDEYNYIFYEHYLEEGIDPCTVAAAICSPRTYGQILAAQVNTALYHMLSYRPWPHFFHTNNLKSFNEKGDTLLFNWLDAVLSAYEGLLTLPVVNAPYHTIARLTESRLQVTGCNDSRPVG